MEHRTLATTVPRMSRLETSADEDESPVQACQNVCVILSSSALSKIRTLSRRNPRVKLITRHTQSSRNLETRILENYSPPKPAQLSGLNRGLLLRNLDVSRTMQRTSKILSAGGSPTRVGLPRRTERPCILLKEKRVWTTKGRRH